MHAASPSRKSIAVVACLSAALALLSGCPRRFDSRADPIPASTDPAIEHEYREARARLEAGDLGDAATRYAAFIEHHPEDTLSRSARLGEARARLGLGQTDKVKLLLEPVVSGAPPGNATTDPLVARARFILGAALVRGGDPQRGRELLRAFRGLAMTSDDEIELHALFAAAALALAEPAEALLELERFYEGARPAERKYILDKAAQAAHALSDTDVEALWRGDKKALLTAFVGMRAADARRQMGDVGGAERIEADANHAREKLGLVERKGGVSPPRTLQQSVGCVLPLSGKLKSLGERALRGALLGAELVGASGQGALALEVRDTGSDPARTRMQVEELVRLGVLAVVGPPDRAESIEASAVAASSRIPTFAIGADDGRGGPSWFRIARPRTDAARAAAKILAADGITRVAILAPDGPAGKELARVFSEEARTRNLTIVAEVRFPDAATTFVREVKQIEAARPQAIFLPTTAAQLDLIAPQLATAGVVAMANLKASGREARLIATADGLSPRSLVRSGKYLQGAVVLPPFWADGTDPRAQAFLDRYRDAYGEEPSVLDALAFDAVRSVRLVLSARGDPRSWDEVASGLRELDAGGLTGALGFSADGNRTGEPAAWVVDGNGLRPRGK